MVVDSTGTNLQRVSSISKMILIFSFRIRKEASNYRTLLDALSFVNESITNQTEIDNPNFKDQFRLVLSFYAGEFPSEKLLPEFEVHPFYSLFKSIFSTEPSLRIGFVSERPKQRTHLRSRISHDSLR